MPVGGSKADAAVMAHGLSPDLRELIQAFLQQQQLDAMSSGDRSHGCSVPPTNRTQQQQPKRLQEQVTQHAQGLRTALGRLAPFGLQVLVSGVAYSSGLGLTQILGMVVRVSCATPILGPCFGALGVGASSVLAGHLSRHSRRQMDAGKTPLQALTAPFWEDFSVDDALLDALSGVLLFKLAGGQFRRLMPSDLRRTGALAYTSVPVGASKYATEGDKNQLVALYKRDGCHHCGSKKGNVIGDHIPPNKLVQDAAKQATDASAVLNTLKNLLAAGSVAGGSPAAKQAYYAQCVRCCQAQAALLRHGRRSALVFHKLRVYPGLTPGILVGFRSLCDPGSPSGTEASPGKRKGGKGGGGKVVESQPGIWTWISRMEEQPPGQDVFRSFEDKGLAGGPLTGQAGLHDHTPGFAH